MFPNEHPGYVLRRLEHQKTELKKLATQLETIDATDPAAMKDAILQIASGLSEVASSTGSLAQWMNRQR
jgi:hypothetical protein